MTDHVERLDRTDREQPVSDERLNSPGPAVSLDKISRRDPSGDGVRWSLQGGDDLNVNLAHLDPGSHVDSHTNYEVDVVVVVLDGDGRLSIDTTDHELAPHVLALAPRGTERSIGAGPSGLTYLTIHRRRGPLRVTEARRSGAGTQHRRTTCARQVATVLDPRSSNERVGPALRGNRGAEDFQSVASPRMEPTAGDFEGSIDEQASSRSAANHGSESKRSRNAAASGSTCCSVPRTRTDHPCR